MTPRFDPSKKKGGAKACWFEIRTKYRNSVWISSFRLLPRNGLVWVRQLLAHRWAQAAAKAGTKRPGAPAGGAAKRGKKLLGWKKNSGHVERDTPHLCECWFSCFRTYQVHSSSRIHWARVCVNVMWCWLYSFSLTEGNVTELTPMSLGLVALGRGLLAFHRGFCASITSITGTFYDR